jgi:PAS domain S-box-containing protein
MIPLDVRSFRMSEPSWRGVIIGLSVAVILITVWCLTHGITTIFMHLYYFPIVLLAYHYRWKGIGPVTLLALTYLGLVIFFDFGQMDVILAGFYRSLVFVGIAAVIAYLSERLVRETRSAQVSGAMRDQYIALAPAIILVLDRHGAITYLNKKGGEILDCNPEEVTGRSWSDQFLPERERERVNRVFSELIAGTVGQNRVIENPVLTGGGTEKVIRWYNTVLHDESGSISGILGYGEDITAEKWAQNALREMQQFQENVIANANVWISVIDTDGTLLVWNEAAEAISGYKKTGVLGKKTIWKQLYPDDRYRKKVTDEIRRILARDEYLENFETEIRCADGSKKTVIWNTRGMRDNKGAVTGYIAIGRDITPQKTAETRARESSRFLGAMIDTLPIPVFFKDAEGRYLGCNPPFEEYIGIPRENLVGRTVYDISPKDLADSYAAADQKLFANPVPQRYETAVQYADGSRHDVIFYKSPFFNKDGTLGGLIGTFLDITERKRMEDALAESELFNRGLVENLPEYLCVYGQDGRILYVNPASAKALGYDAAALAGTHVLSYVAEEYRATAAAKLSARIQDGDRSSYELVLVSKDGQRRSVLVKATPIQYRNNPAILLLLMDITDARRDQEALQKSEEMFRAFFTTSRDCVFITTLEGTWVDFNDAAVELFGYENREDLLKVKIPDLYANTDERDAHIAYIRKNGSSFEYPVDLKRKDGTIINALVTTVARNDTSGTIIGFQGSIRDITERKRNERLLLENQTQLATAMDLAHLATWELNVLTGTFTFNDRFYAMYGTTAEREGGYTMPAEVYAREFVYPDDAFLVGQEVKKAVETHDPKFTAQVEHRVIRRDGKIRHILVRHAVIKDDSGRTIKTYGANQDITDRKLAEEALAMEKQRMESLLSLSLTSRKADADIISQVVEDSIRLTGSAIGYLATMNRDETVMTMQYWSKSAHESCKIIDRPLVYPLEKTGLWGEAVRQRRPVVTNDYAADSPFKRGTPHGHVPLTRHMNIPVFDGDHIVAVAGVGNKGADYNEGDIRQLQLLMQGWWQIVVRRRAEEALRSSEGRLHTLVQTIPDLIWLKDKEGVYLACNPMFERFFGAKEADIVGKTDYDFVNRELADSFRENDRRAMAAGKPTRNEEWITFADDGHRALLETTKTPVLDASGLLIGVLGIGRDITGRKQAEEVIRQNQLELRNAMDIAHVVNWEYDVSEGLFTFNDRFYTLFGTTAEREGGYRMSAETYAREFVHPEDIPAVGEEIRKLLSTPDPHYRGQMEHRIIRRDGEVRTIIARYAPVMDEHGQVIRTFGANQDITERRRMEDALLESRQLFADIISFLPDATLVIDKDGKVLAWNRAIEQLSGIPSKDMIGKGDYAYSVWLYGTRRPILIDLVLHPDQDHARLNYSNIHWEGKTVTAETEATQTGFGHKIPLSLVASPLIDPQGRIIGAIESMRDISQLKKAEENLARFNANLEKIIRERTQALNDEIVQRKYAEQEVLDALSYTRSVIEANPDLMVVLDREGAILDVNTAAESLTGIPREELIGSSYSRYLMDDATPRDILARLLSQGRINYTLQLRRSDGHVIPVSVNSTLFRGNDSSDARIIVAAHDITRQKQDEAVIRAALDEQVILLREVHHRVKNNLQIIISLTNLQMRQTDDPGVKQIMSETQNRVRAMSLVHEKLYRSESLSRIDFADYTRFLATQLFSYYGMDTRRVRLDFAMAKIMVDINMAVPLGLMMNELISNALKHAFPNGRDGVIRIGGHDVDNTITLVVADTGVGIPGDLDWKNTASLGMRLVTSLIDQVDGTIVLDRAGGTTFTITVKRETPQDGSG